MKKNRILALFFGVALLIALLFGMTKCQTFQHFQVIETKQATQAVADSTQYENLAAKLDSASKVAKVNLGYSRRADSLLADTVNKFRLLLLASEQERQIIADRERLQKRYLHELKTAFSTSQSQITGVLGAFSDTLTSVRGEVSALRIENQIRQKLLTDSLAFTAKIVRSMEDSLNTRYRRQSQPKAVTVPAKPKKNNRSRPIRRPKAKVHKSVPTNGLFDLFKKKK